MSIDCHNEIIVFQNDDISVTPLSSHECYLPGKSSMDRLSEWCGNIYPVMTYPIPDPEFRNHISPDWKMKVSPSRNTSRWCRTLCRRPGNRRSTWHYYQPLSEMYLVRREIVHTLQLIDRHSVPE